MFKVSTTTVGGPSTKCSWSISEWKNTTASLRIVSPSTMWTPTVYCRERQKHLNFKWRGAMFDYSVLSNAKRLRFPKSLAAQHANFLFCRRFLGLNREYVSSVYRSKGSSDDRLAAIRWQVSWRVLPGCPNVSLLVMTSQIATEVEIKTTRRRRRRWLIFLQRAPDSLMWFSGGVPK